MKRINWKQICDEAELKGLNPISLRFFKEYGRYPTKKELMMLIDKVVMNDHKYIDKKKIYPVKRKFEKWLENEQKKG